MAEPLRLTGLALLLHIVLYSCAECARQRDIPMFQPLSEEMIRYINDEAQTTWKAGSNRRFNHANDVRRSLGTIPDPNQFRLPAMCSFTTTGESKPIPEKFDARTEWPECPSIAEIRDQSSCGSCWAFGAVEAMSDRICIASKGQSKPFLSAENLVDCCHQCGMGCNGGFPPQAWKYWNREGIVTGDLYGSKSGCQPYSFPPCEHHVIGPRPSCDRDVETPKCMKTCQEGYNVTYAEDKWYGEVVYSVPSDQEHIKRELMTHGPLEVSFEVYADFPSYRSGVYQHVAGGLLGGHAVRLVGWGEEDGVPYWLLANSWNTDWGDQGYFKILRGSNECGIESDVNGGKPKLKKN